MAVTTSQVQALYIAYFNRPADFFGLTFQTAQANQFGLQFVADQFSKSPEYLGTYAGKGIGDVVDTIYLNLFGRHAEPAGLKFWGDLLSDPKSGVTIGNAAITIATGAINDDKVSVANKLIAADAFYASLDTTSEIVGYSGDKANQVLKTWLSTITTQATLDAAITPAALLAVSTAATAAHDGAVTTTVGLTTGVDTLVGTAGNEVFNALIDSTGTPANSTLTVLDSIDGGAGNDTLNINAITAVANLNGLAITNVETLNVRAASSFTGNVSGLSGLTAANVTQAVGAVDLTVGSGTAVKISGATAGVTTTGGSSVNVVKAMDGAPAGAITINKAGAVSVTATGSVAAAGGIDIGSGVGNAATGAVDVTSTGAAVVGGTGAVSLDTIKVTGGTTVNVTQHAVAGAGDSATAAIATDVITQGAVTIVGGAATTAVNVIQDDQADAAAASAGTTAVSATKVVTFVPMAAGDTVTIDGLVFHAVKTLTAAEVAAAFAGLSAGSTTAESLGQGFSANGYYTGTSTHLNWSTGAAVGNTVTFSQKVAGATNLTLSQSIAGTAVVTEVLGVNGVLNVDAAAGSYGVANGVVTIDDNATAASIKTIKVDGYSAGATIGATNSLNALTSVSLANSGGGAAAITTTAAALGLTLNDVNDNNGGSSAVTINDASLKALAITTATGNSSVVLSAGSVTALTVDGTNSVSLSSSSTLTSLDSIVVKGAAGLTVTSASATSVDTTATTGTVKATISSAAATYTGGAGTDNVVFSNTTAATKAISLGAGNDSVTIADLSSLATPTATIDGGDGTDTLIMSSANAAAATVAYAAKFTNFEKLSLGKTLQGAADSVDLSVMNNYNYVISAGSVIAAVPTATVTQGTAISAEKTTFAFGAGLNAGESFTIDGLTVTSSGANSAAAVEAVFASGVTAGTLTVTGSYAVPTTWTGVAASTVGGNLVLTNSVNGDVTDFTTASGAGSGTGTLTITKMVNAGTLELTGAGTGATVVMTDATSTTADVLNIVTKVSTSSINHGTVTVAGVETINLTVTDTAPTTSSGSASIQTSTLAIADAALTKLVVSGNAALTFTGSTNVALATLDGSAMTGKLTASTNGVVAETITGGAGSDALTSLSTGTVADTLIGGAGNDTLTANKGLTTLTGGTGTDAFVVAVASLNVNSYATITDATAGETITFGGTFGAFAASKVSLGATAVFQDYANAATTGAATNALSWFQFGGDTYIIKDVNANTSGFVNGSDMIVKLVGAVDLSHASYSTTTGVIQLG
jgi:hypothetical protein